MKTIKNKIQRIIKGHSDEDVNNLSQFVIDLMREPLKKLVKFEAEHGNPNSLPEEFKTDPAMWLLILRKIEYAFDHEYLNEHDWDGHEETEEHLEKVREGFELFGKYFRVMKIRK